MNAKNAPLEVLEIESVRDSIRDARSGDFYGDIIQFSVLCAYSAPQSWNLAVLSMANAAPRRVEFACRN